MRGQLLGLVSAMVLAAAASPAEARRTVIDENPDGTPLYYSLGGYCDFNTDDCDPAGGVTLPYFVKIGADAPTDRIWVHGNGILGFGGSADFYNVNLSDTIFYGGNPALTDYGFTLVSAGQNNFVYRDQFNGYVFMQSADLRVRSNGSIVATWFTCDVPTSPTKCPPSNIYRLTLKPTAEGYLGNLDFSQGAGGDDTGYVTSDGDRLTFTPTGNRFLLPASFSGNVTFVPEPQSWALLIAGFGLTGAAMRRRRSAAA